MIRKKKLLRFASLVLWGVVLLSGCAHEVITPPERSRPSLDSLAIKVGGVEREFLFSDRSGAFLHGRAGGEGALRLSWSVNGKELVSGIRISVNGRPVEVSDSIAFVVSPDRFSARGVAGWELQIAPLEMGAGGSHALGMRFLGLRGGAVSVTLRPAMGSRAGSIRLIAVPGARTTGLTATADGADSLDLIAYLPPAEGRDSGMVVGDGGLAGPFQTRRERMESLLERAYLRLSDPLLTRAMAWFRLSLDALVCEGEETSFVGSWPWDGSFSGRENLRSIGGEALVTGDFSRAADLLDTWGRGVDRRAGSPTYGRIPGRMGGGTPTYDAIDASGWFARALYEYVVASGDTALGRALYPVVKRGIEGMRARNLGPDTLIHHRAGETWTDPERFAGAPGPYTAVEVQSLWQMEQTIGSIIAQGLQDTSAARSFAQGAVDAGIRFTRVFVDTSRRILHDFVDQSGVPHDGLGASGLLATESLDGELMMSALVRRSVNGLLTPYGPMTGERGGIATWLTGPFVYALSRSDREDLGAVVTSNLAEYALERGMVGMLPGGFVRASGDPRGFRGAMPAASLSAMAEFVRLVYQDFLGIRIDVPSAVVRFEPKLPAGIDSVDVTVHVGAIPLRALYVRGKETSRMTIGLGDVPRPVKWRFIWLFDNGDGWMGAARVPPGGTLTAIFGPEEMLLYSGDEQVVPEEKWFIRGLSQRKEFSGLTIGGGGSSSTAPPGGD